MGWTDKIRNILGRFWTVAFGDRSFLRGILNSLYLMAKQTQVLRDRNRSSVSALDESRYADAVPFVIYMLKQRLSGTGASADFEDAIDHDCFSLEDVFDGDADLGDVDEARPWIVRTKGRYPAIHHITNHAVDYGRTFLHGMDFDQADGELRWYVPDLLDELDSENDPENAFEVVDMVDDDGTLCRWYKAFGWHYPTLSTKDMVAAFETRCLNEQAGLVWRMHQEGATALDVKRLFAAVTGSVVADRPGTVIPATGIWKECGAWRISVTEDVPCASSDLPEDFVPTSTVYCAQEGADLSPLLDLASTSSVHVNTGDVLAGPMRVYDERFAAAGGGSDTEVQRCIPAMPVMTDVGTVVVANDVVSSIVVNSSTTTADGLLPVEAQNSAEYYSRCAELRADPGCPVVDISMPVNPMKFVMGTLRRTRSVFISVPALGNIQRLSAAVDVSRRCADAGGMVSVYLRSDGMDVPSASVETFEADAGEAAVSVSGLDIVIDMFADVKAYR